MTTVICNERKPAPQTYACIYQVHDYLHHFSSDKCKNKGSYHYNQLCTTTICKLQLHLHLHANTLPHQS